MSPEGRAAALPLGYALLSLAGGALFGLGLLATSFALRDAFCYPGYIAALAAALSGPPIFAAPALGPATVLAARRLATHPARWGLALGPLSALALALVLLWAAGSLTRLVNDAHCAAGPPGLQDNSATVPGAARALVGAAWAAGLAAAALSILAFRACLRAPRG